MKPNISFDAPTDGSFGPARELLCSVWPLSKEGEQLSIGDPVLSNSPVLVGPLRLGESPSTLELPEAGAYLINLGYPNGASFRTTISVAEGEQYRITIPSKRPASHSAGTTTPPTNLIPRVVSATLKTIHLKEPDLEVKVVAQPQGVRLRSLREFAAEVSASSISAEVLERVANADLAHSLRLPNSPVANFKWGYQRRWLVVAGGARNPTMVAYPVGWTDEAGDAFSLSMHRKSKDGSEATKWSVALKLMNPVFGSLIEHLTRRDVQSGREISQSMRGQATTMLYEKEGNPFAAVAGAYLLALGREELDHRCQWMSNLSKWFEWLPDGPIALGWALLREGCRGSPEWSEARGLFLTACSRGLPYYTIGLHVLVEALTLLSMAEPDDTEVRDTLAAARAADVACVRSEPFTTLQVSRFLGLPVQ
ncbi:hypothetical protein AZOA_39800 [Azoarcus sp. Aa7]|nr:hypothetical protein [Azoarcus sp. Aa7]